jgi:hypothetical protein
VGSGRIEASMVHKFHSHFNRKINDTVFHYTKEYRRNKTRRSRRRRKIMDLFLNILGSKYFLIFIILTHKKGLEWKYKFVNI